MSQQIFKTINLLLICFLLSGCAKNPVTQQWSLDFYPEDLEISTGERQYPYQRQIYQGDYVVDPNLVSYVSNIGHRLAAVSDRVLPYEFAVVNSSKLNAWALPGGKVAVTRGLIMNLECESELAAVLAHEIVHAAAGHGTSNQSWKSALELVGVASSLLIHDDDSLAWIHTALYIGGNLALLRYSRSQELEADYYGMNYMDRAGFNPRGMISLQETLKALSHKDENWLKTLFSTHPQFDERIIKARQHLNDFSGKLYPDNSARYQDATRYLKEKREAYEYYDLAINAVRREDIENAAFFINEAISIEPKEALFYALRAKISLKNQQVECALADLDKAVSLNPDYWQQYMTRGVAYESIGEFGLAYSDYKKSAELLPTVEAYYALGRLAAAYGNEEEAVEYLKMAWKPGTAMGEEAGKLLAQLDLETNPNYYFRCVLSRDDQKNIVVEIRNITPLSVIVQEIKLQKLHGLLHWKKKKVFQIHKILEPGQTLIFYTNWGPIKKSKLYKYRAKVTEAYPMN